MRQMLKPRRKTSTQPAPAVHTAPPELKAAETLKFPEALTSPATAYVFAGDRLLERDFARLAEMVSEYVGIRLPPSKRIMLEGRLRKRVRTLGLPSIAEYCRLLANDDYLEAEFIHLVDAATTNKTDFFREPKHFDCLRDEIVPDLLAHRRPHTGHILKVWSAASSMGAEAYSIAMLLADMGQAGASFNFAILGTDISTEVLAQARRAVYPEEMIRPIPPDIQMRYLMRARDGRSGGLHRIVPELRRRCRFVRLNLMDRAYPFDRDVDVIFLRNVLIYFDKPTQEAVIGRLVAHLRPGGYLLLGHSESMIGTALQLRQIAPSVFQHR
jgi:chemotaxis protein methyltransferase CheR